MPELTPLPERISLDGEWQLAFDPEEQGLARGWLGGGWPVEQAHAERVPALWDVAHPFAEGVGFYRRSFDLPAEWSEKVVLLHFAGAAYRAEAWVNGQFAGSHEGAYTPFCFDVTRLVRTGAGNELVVRVAGLSRTRAVDGQVLIQAPVSKQNWHYIYGGLWGAVHLEAREWVAVQAVHVEPDLQRESAQVTVVLHNRRAEHRMVQLRLSVAQPDGATCAELGGEVAVPPGEVRLTYPVPLPHPWPWHYDTPHLYAVQVEAQDGPAAVERFTFRFGMRDFTVRDGQFSLNGSAVYVRGILLQPNYPVGLLVPPEPDMLRREIMLAKGAGFNLIRLHIQPAPAGFLDLADELGILIYAESSLAWIRESPRMPEHCRREVQALIERDFNHPSVVIWGIFNENPPASALLSEMLMRHARALDPTRVVLDNSGGALAIDQDFGWIDRATVVGNRDTVRQPILDIHLYLGPAIPNAVYEWLRTVGGSGSAAVLTDHDFGSVAVFAEFDRQARAYRGKVFVSELGCGGMQDLEQAVAGFGERTDLRDARELRAFRDSLRAGFTERRLEAIFGSPRSLALAAQELQAAGNAAQMEALLRNPQVSGYVLTQLNDVSWEFHAGLTDVWRNPKPAYYTSQRLNQPQVLILRAAAQVVAGGEDLVLELAQVNGAQLPAGARVVVGVRDPAGRESQVVERAAPTALGIHELGQVSSRSSAPGFYEVSARVQLGEQVLAETQHRLLALAPVDWTTLPAHFAWIGQPLPVQAQIGQAGGRAEPPVLVAGAPASLQVEDWQTLLDAVEAGQTAVVGPLHPRDELGLRQLQQRGLPLRLHMGIGSWMGVYHWIPQSDLFAGLPAGGLAGATYAEVLPWYVLSELGGEVLAGSLRHTTTLQEVEPSMLWHSDLEIVRLGAGQIVFCQYRLFEQAHTQPLAAQLLANLLRLADRRRLS